MVNARKCIFHGWMETSSQKWEKSPFGQLVNAKKRTRSARQLFWNILIKDVSTTMHALYEFHS